VRQGAICPLDRIQPYQRFDPQSAGGASAATLNMNTNREVRSEKRELSRQFHVQRTLI
jgi:hypothetical protein